MLEASLHGGQFTGSTQLITQKIPCPIPYLRSMTGLLETNPFIQCYVIGPACVISSSMKGAQSEGQNTIATFLT